MQSQTSSTVEESHEESTVQESDVDIDLMAESDSDSEESNNGDILFCVFFFFKILKISLQFKGCLVDVGFYH